MDAISFVLGVQSRGLRSSQLKDLIHRSPHNTSGQLFCRVTLVYEHDDDEEDEGETQFGRRIDPSGHGSYFVNQETVTYAKYVEALSKIGVLVKARNFLVFQGDVEALARKTPAELTQLFETVSRSIEYKDDYEKAAEKATEAEQSALHSLRQQKVLRQERKLLQEQKNEAEKFQRLLEKKRMLQTDLYLWQLYHLEQERHEKQTAVDDAKEELGEQLKAESEASKALAAAKKEASTVRRQHQQAEKKRVQCSASVDQLDTALLQSKQQVESLQKKLTQDEKNLESQHEKAEKHNETLQAMKDEIVKFRSTLEELEKDYASIKQSVAEVSLTSEQEEEYEKVREAAASASSEPKRKLVALQRQLESARSKAANQDQEYQDAVKQARELQKDVADFTERRDKLVEVSGYAEIVIPYDHRSFCFSFLN
jgi:structural maintenance of chromosome 1